MHVNAVVFLFMFPNFWWQANLKFKFMEMSVENQRWRNRRWELCQKAPHMHALQIIFHTLSDGEWTFLTFGLDLKWSNIIFWCCENMKSRRKNLHICSPFWKHNATKRKNGHSDNKFEFEMKLKTERYLGFWNRLVIV